jgi:IclR family KDG regulon transcriptional repressor
MSKSITNNGIQSLERVLNVIEYLAVSRLPSRLTDIANSLKMSQSTVLRYLRALCAQGYVYHDELTGCYALTWKICRLRDLIKVNLVLRSMASSFLNSLANTLNVAVCLVVVEDYGTQYLDFVDKPSNSMSTMTRIGKDAPIHSTASGKVLLCSLPEHKFNEIMQNMQLVSLTPNTIVDKDVLVTELEQIRKRGYAIDNEECEEGYKCVSLPLFDYSGRVAAAISVTDRVHLLTDDRIENEILPELKKVADEISFRMGYDKTDPFHSER